MKTLGRAVLTLEWLVFALAVPVAINIAGANPTPVLLFLVTVTVVMVAAIRTLPSRTGIVLGWIVQALALLSGIVVLQMLILGAIFTGLWFMAVQMGTAADVREAETSGPAGSDRDRDPSAQIDLRTSAAGSATSTPTESDH